MTRADPLALRRAWLLGAAVVAQGCAVSTGSFAGLMSDGRTVDVGQKLDARVHLAERSGVVLGIEEQIATRVVGDPCCSQWRVLADVGYAQVPTVASSPLGFDVLALVGAGRMPSASNEVVGGFVGGAQVALPIRLTRRRELWQADDYIGTSWQVVPDLGVLALVPVEGGDRRVDLEVGGGLSLRVFIDSAVLP